MKSSVLFPHRFKKIGWFLFVPGLIMGLIYLFLGEEYMQLNLSTFAIAKQSLFEDTQYFTTIQNNVLDEIIGLLIIIGALFITFSREKIEDEYISRMRLNALVWATLINYSILILAIIFMHELVFFHVLVINMFTLLIFFIIRFNWLLSQSSRLSIYEE